MKRFGLSCFFVFIMLSLLAGCKDSAANSDAPWGNSGTDGDGSVAFEYFYRGFTPIMDEDALSVFESVSGIVFIQDQDGLQRFMSTYCPGIAYLVADFSEESLIAISEISGAKSAYAASYEIKEILFAYGGIDVIIDDTQTLSEKVFALNSGVAHWFVNIVKVRNSDMPPDAGDLNRY